VKFVGLGGGIGSGKSTVGTRLAERGAYVIDVDVLSRQIQRPGTRVFDAIVERWGRDVLAPDGTLDRVALGRVVFADPDELAVLTAQITGPAIEAELINRAGRHLGTDDAVLAEAAMFQGRTRCMYGMTGVIVVDVPTETAVARLVARGMDEDDARTRIARQIPRDTRLVHADFVIDNSDGPEQLGRQVDAAWEWILASPDAVPDRDARGLR
jgi:dephospho-CoA kinase